MSSLFRERAADLESACTKYASATLFSRPAALERQAAALRSDICRVTRREQSRLIRRRRAGLWAITGAAVGLYAAAATGAEWSLAPSVGLGVYYDTNPALITGEHESSSGAYGNAILGFQYATERSQANIGAAYYGARYREEGYENDDEGVIGLRSFTRPTERQTLGLDGEYRRSSLYEQRAKTEPGTGDIRDTDVGLARVRRDYWWAEPRWGIQMTERNALDIRYRHTEAQYDEILDDYDEDIGTVAVAHTLNPRDDIRFGVRGSRYRSPSADSRSTTSTVFLGFGRAFTATSRMELYVGGAKATEETGTDKYDVTGYVFRVGFTQRTELTRLELVLSRDAHPSGGGRLVASDQVRMDLHHRVAERSEIGLRAWVFRDSVLQGEDPTLDRTYAEIEPAWSWNWTPELAVITSYRYRWQKYDVNETAASSNAVFAGLGYSWPKYSVSR